MKIEVENVKITIMIAFLSFILVSCMPSAMSAPTETPTPIVTFTPVPSSTFTPVPTSIPLPTQLTAQAASYPTHVIMTPNPDQLERWQEYEDALRNRLMEYELSNGTVLCEWRILGQSDQEVYVWTLCLRYPPLEGSDDLFASSSRPAVIQFSENSNRIQNVEVPRAGTYARDIREMFPPDVQESIFRDFYDVRELKDHILYRIEHPEVPPLIVLDATPMP